MGTSHLLSIDLFTTCQVIIDTQLNFIEDNGLQASCMHKASLVLIDSHISVRALSDLGGGGWRRQRPSCPKKFRQFPNAWLLKTGCKCTHIAWKQTCSQFPHLLKPCGMKLLREFNFTDFGFFEFRGNKFSWIWISNFTPGKNFFADFMCGTWKWQKQKPYFWLHCLQSIWLKFGNLNKRSKFLRNFFWREFVFTGFNSRRSIKHPRKLDPTQISCHTVIPKIVLFKDCILNQSINHTLITVSNPSKI